MAERPDPSHIWIPYPDSILGYRILSDARVKVAMQTDGVRLRCRWFGCDVDGSYEQLALVENGAGTDEGDQVWRVDCAPAGLVDFEYRFTQTAAQAA
jgi:hypothetical protein